MARFSSDPVNINNITGDIIPSEDNVFTLGSAEKRWAEFFIGPGTIYITDNVTGDDAEITVSDGVLKIDGANQLQVGQLRFVDNTIKSETPDIDIQIGETSATGDIVLNRDVIIAANKSITFDDGTEQTTAYIPLEEISYTVQGGTDGTQPTFTGDPLFTGNYIKNGANQVHFEIQVDMDNITSFGTGQYYVTLPFAAKYAYTFRDGCVHDSSAGDRSYQISGHVSAGSDFLQLEATDVTGQAIFDVPFTPTFPITLTTADNFHLAGNYIADLSS